MPQRYTSRINKKLSSYSDDKLRELYLEKNLPVIVIANNLGCSSTKIERKIRELNIQRRKRKNDYHSPQLTIQEVREIRKLCFLSPLTHEQIGHMFGKHKTTITNIYKGRNYKE